MYKRKASMDLRRTLVFRSTLRKKMRPIRGYLRRVVSSFVATRKIITAIDKRLLLPLIA